MIQEEGGSENRLQVERCNGPPGVKGSAEWLGEERLADGSRLEDIQGVQGGLGWFGRLASQ